MFINLKDKHTTVELTQVKHVHQFKQTTVELIQVKHVHQSERQTHYSRTGTGQTCSSI